MAKPFRVLFLCTGNSARSILAEAVLNHPPIGQGRFRAYSAGSHPKGQVSPLALELLDQQHIATDGLRSMSWGELAKPGAPELDFVFTVCDKTAAEQCPLWPGQPMTAHWRVPDPAMVEGTVDEQRKAYREAFMTLKRPHRAVCQLANRQIEPARAGRTRATDWPRIGPALLCIVVTPPSQQRCAATLLPATSSERDDTACKEGR